MRNIFEDPHKHYDVPRFTKDKIKETFLKHEGWKVLDEGEGYISFMKDGYVDLEGFQVLFITNEEEAKEEDYPIGEGYMIQMQPWVAVDWSEPEWYNSIEDMVQEAENHIKTYGDKNKLTPEWEEAYRQYPNFDKMGVEKKAAIIRKLTGGKCFLV